MTKKPNGWEKCHLRDLLHVKHGLAFKGEHIDTSGPYVLVTPGNFFEEGGFKRNGDKQKRYRGAVPSEYILSAGSLVVAMTEQAEGLLGSAAFVPDDEIYLHNQRIGLITSENTDIRFLYYLLNTSAVRQQIRGSSSGTKVRHTSPSRIGEVTAWLPPVAVQSRIAAFLTAYDDLIEVNQRRIAILEDMARRLFDEWFIQPIGSRLPIPGDRLDEWALPTSWRFSSLIATANVTMGQSPASNEYNEKNEGMPFHQGVTDFEGKFHTNRLFLRPEFTWKRTAEQGDILFSVRAPVGRIAIALDSLALGRGLCAIRDLSDGQAFLLTHLLISFPKPDMFGGGTIYKAVTKDDVHSIPILLPPRELRDAFEKLVSPIWEQVKALTLANMQLRRARDLLLPKLVSGEIAVWTAEVAFAEAAE